MKKFWNYIRDDSGGRVLRLEGPIDEESFWGDEITPRAFREELEAEDGDLTVWINSPGGNVFAAAEIYTMLRDYKGAVTVRIASIAASAASVVAMAGSLVQMSPTALLMVHDPSTIAMGNTKDMERAIATLNEVKESIINAYAFKTGLTRSRISKLMENETWLNAKKAVELGFADEILFEDKPKPEEEPDDPEKEGGDEDGKDGEEEEKKPFKLQGMWPQEGQLFSTRLMGQTILNRLGASCQPESDQPEPEDAASAQKPSEDGLKEPEDTKPPMPLIGMDGKTEDGSMPYEILKDKLEWLK